MQQIISMVISRLLSAQMQSVGGRADVGMGIPMGIPIPIWDGYGD